MSALCAALPKKILKSRSRATPKRNNKREKAAWLRLFFMLFLACFYTNIHFCLDKRARVRYNIYNLYKLNIDDRIVKIKDNTKPDIDISAVARQNNLKGLFVKEILNEMENSNIDKNTLENVLEIGLDILEK